MFTTNSGKLTSQGSLQFSLQGRILEHVQGEKMWLEVLGSLVILGSALPIPRAVM